MIAVTWSNPFDEKLIMHKVIYSIIVNIIKYVHKTFWYFSVLHISAIRLVLGIVENDCMFSRWIVLGANKFVVIFFFYWCKVFILCFIYRLTKMDFRWRHRTTSTFCIIWIGFKWIIPSRHYCLWKRTQQSSIIQCCHVTIYYNTIIV